MKKRNHSVLPVIGISLFFVVVVVGIGLQHRAILQREKAEAEEELEANAQINELVMQPVATPTMTNSVAGMTAEAQASPSPSPTNHKPKPTGMNEGEVGGMASTSGQVKTNTLTNTDEAMVRGVGSVTRSGITVEYIVNFPKEGGAISGQGKGDCMGEIRGTFYADTKNASGLMEGTCKVENETLTVKGIFSGKIYLSVGSGYGEWEGNDDQDREAKGEWEIDFKPVEEN